MPTAADVAARARLLADMWLSSAADFFVGNAYSTVTMTVCLLRGAHSSVLAAFSVK